MTAAELKAKNAEILEDDEALEPNPNRFADALRTQLTEAQQLLLEKALAQAWNNAADRAKARIQWMRSENKTDLRGFHIDTLAIA